MKIELNIKSLENKIVCGDLRAIQLLLGSTAVVGNLRLYKVAKKNNCFEISKSDLRSRLQTLINRRAKLNESISLMEQALRQ